MFFRKHRHSLNELDQPLLTWTSCDWFSRRDLTRSVCIQGASGSGKTNFVGYGIAKAIVRDRGIGGLILASKAGEDRQYWQSIFAEAGRRNDLSVFAPICLCVATFSTGNRKMGPIAESWPIA